MRNQVIVFAALYAIVVGGTSCSSGGSNNVGAFNNGAGAPYVQIERLARPAVKEATQPFAQHDDTNRTSPWQQPYSSQSLYNAIGSFTTTVAGRDAKHAQTLQALLIPDEIAVDLSQTTTKAAYLGVETGGVTGSKYGGRALSDDVIDIDLGAIFGTTLSDLGLIPDDGKASPCLTTDNVGYNQAAKKNTNVFPYVGAPN